MNQHTSFRVGGSCLVILSETSFDIFIDFTRSLCIDFGFSFSLLSSFPSVSLSLSRAEARDVFAEDEDAVFGKKLCKEGLRPRDSFSLCIV